MLEIYPVSKVASISGHSMTVTIEIAVSVRVQANLCALLSEASRAGLIV